MTAAAGRLLTNQELAELNESPRERVSRRLLAIDVDGAVAVVERMEQEMAGQIDRYSHWISALFQFLTDRHGVDGGALAVRATCRLFATYPQVGTLVADAPGSIVVAVRDSGEADPHGTLRVVDEHLARWRDHIDLHRDWISLVLSELYRQHGPDELEAAHRHVGQRTMAGLTAHLDAPAKEQLESFVWLLYGHFSEITVTEEADRFVLSQHPCGTCGRQAQQGRHGPPLSLAVVQADHLVTWGGRPTTIYRTHVPVWHIAMAGEQIGGPWPVNQCPIGPDAGECRILLYKDPRDSAAAGELPGSVSVPGTQRTGSRS